MSDELPILALVVPCYNEECIIEESCEKLINTLNKLVEKKLVSDNSYISFINDGSSDSSWEKLCNLSKNNTQIKAINLLYNTGHQNALYCGMIENNADLYITLDCDLQDDLNIIEEMIRKSHNEDVDIVYAIRSNRDCDNFCKKFFAEAFYSILPLFNIKHLQNCADFRLVNSDVINFLKKINENNLYLRGLLQEYNFKHTTVTYVRKERIGGKEKYSFRKSFELALDAITNSSIMPIRLITFLGLAGIILSALSSSEMLMCCGFNFIAIGIVGEYIGRTFIETKKRPAYIIKQRINN